MTLGPFQGPWLPVGLGLLGFVEPCAIGATLIFVKSMEGQSGAHKLAQVTLFTAVRALVIGALGALAALVGTHFLGFQRGVWISLGALYFALGLAFLLGKASLFSVSLGPTLTRLGNLGGSAVLGAAFGLNVPACAAPLLAALLGAAAAHATRAAGARQPALAMSGDIASGFTSLALFGLALSLPLVAAVLIPPARRSLDGLAALSRRIPRWTGALLLALGAWSIRLALKA